MSRKKVIVGGGITGLFSAMLLLEKCDGEDIILVEKGKIGGLLRSFHYHDFGCFDIAMCIIFCICNDDFDGADINIFAVIVC